MQMEITGDATSVDSDVNACIQAGRPNILESREGEVERTRVGERLIRRSEDVSVMDPAMWSTLPKELLLLVFARLPLPQLLSLRRSSLEGKWDINLDDSEFMRLCAQKHSNLCAIILQETDSAIYSVGVHCVKSTSWQKLRLSSREPSNTMCSSNGGLVCFALTFESEKKNGRFRFMLVVVNPLTGDCRVLPGHGVTPFQPTKMKLVMDRNTKRYQVILVLNECASVEEFARFGAVLFDSWTGVWTNAKNSSQLFLGPTIHEDLYSKSKVYKMDDCGDHLGLGLGPRAYECATGVVLYIEQYDFCDYADSIDYALIKDHLFLLELHWDADDLAIYTLSEHQVQVQKDELSCQI